MKRLLGPHPFRIHQILLRPDWTTSDGIETAEVSFECLGQNGDSAIMWGYSIDRRDFGQWPPTEGQIWDHIRNHESDFQELLVRGEEALRRQYLEKAWKDEPYRDVGRKVSGGGKEGHKQTYGTAEEKQERWAEWKSYILKMHKLHSTWDYNTLTCDAGKHFKVHQDTIKKHVRLKTLLLDL